VYFYWQEAKNIKVVVYL